MHDPRRRTQGDISGPIRGDTSAGEFADWDNPEDEDEDWDEESGDADELALGPDDPDYDLSEEAAYADWEPPPRRGLVPQWLIVAISLLLILAILTPVLIRLN